MLVVDANATFEQHVVGQWFSILLYTRLLCHHSELKKKNTWKNLSKSAILKSNASDFKRS